MKKILAAVLITGACLGLLISGCGGNMQEFEHEGIPAPASPPILDDLQEGAEVFGCVENCEGEALCDLINTRIVSLNEDVDFLWMDTMIGKWDGASFEIPAVWEDCKGDREGDQITLTCNYTDLCRVGHQTPTCSNLIPLNKVFCQTAIFEKLN